MWSFVIEHQGGGGSRQTGIVYGKGTTEQEAVQDALRGFTFPVRVPKRPEDCFGYYDTTADATMTPAELMAVAYNGNIPLSGGWTATYRLLITATGVPFDAALSIGRGRSLTEEPKA